MSKKTAPTPKTWSLCCIGQLLLLVSSALRCSIDSVKFHWRKLVFHLPASIKAISLLVKGDTA